MELHRKATVIDTGIGGLPFKPLMEGGVTATLASIAGQSGTGAGVGATMQNICRYLGAVYVYPDQLSVITRPEDIRAAKRDGKLGYIFFSSGMTYIGSDLFWLEVLSRVGVRVMGLTYNAGNQFGAGAGEPNDTGLTYLGKQAVFEMNRLRVAIDLSHVGDRTARDIVEISESPPIFTHSNARALVDHPRNAPDDLMKAVAQRGGLQCISVYAPMLDAGTFPTLDDMIRHIEYAVNLCGIDRVGIGTDTPNMDDASWILYKIRHRSVVPEYYQRPPYLSGTYHRVQGFRTAADFPRITEALLARGYKEEDVLKILGGNWLRVLEEIWGNDVMPSLPPDRRLS
jgi:membrane dipeptidase